MRASELKVLLMQRKLKTLPVDWSIDGLPELDGQLAMVELPMQELKDASGLAETRDGVDDLLMMAALVAKSLIAVDGLERLYADTELSSITSWGASVLKPLAELAAKASGLDTAALEDAKKN